MARLRDYGRGAAARTPQLLKKGPRLDGPRNIAQALQGGGIVLATTRLELGDRANPQVAFFKQRIIDPVERSAEALRGPKGTHVENRKRPDNVSIRTHKKRFYARFRPH